MSIFNGIEGLDIKDPEYRFVHGSYGIPEFGTKFVRQMLDDTKPEAASQIWCGSQDFLTEPMCGWEMHRS